MYSTHDAVASSSRPAREIASDIRRESATQSLREWDEIPLRHPAIPESWGALTQTLIRCGVVFVMVGVLALALAGCSVYEHRDSGGYTVRYSAVNGLVEAVPPPPKVQAPVRPRRVVEVRPIVIVEGPRPPHGESHPVLNVGKDSEIPTEYAKYVSDRGIKTIRARGMMCKTSRPGYCNAPNVPHCHGSFCHAHEGGDKRHTH